MDEKRKCTECDMNLDLVKQVKHTTVWESCYSEKRRRNNNNISRHKKESKVLMTRTKTNEPQTPNQVLEILEVLEVLKLCSFRT